MQTKSIDTPLAQITLRRYEKPLNLTKRELVRKICLSFGLLNPGDSRDVIVDVLYVLIESKQKMNSEEVREAATAFRKNEGLDDNGTAGSNIRRQIRRLREVFLVEKVKNDYRITENLSLTEIFADKIEKFYIPSLIERIKEYLLTVDNEFK